MDLTSYQLSESLKKFPEFELSYETIQHKKVCINYDLCMAIPSGKKYFIWHTFHRNLDVCYLLEISKQKEIVKGTCISNSGNYKFSLGTVLYGTLLEDTNVFICEDDITFTKPEVFMKQANKFFNSDKIKKWDVCIVAGNNVPPYEAIDDFCIKVSHCQTTTGYIVNEHYYDTLIQNYREGIQKLISNPERHVHFAIDKHWINLQHRDKWYLIVPATVIQLEDYSDIEGRVVNYNWHMLDIDKKEFLERRRAQMAMTKRF